MKKTLPGLAFALAFITSNLNAQVSGVIEHFQWKAERIMENTVPGATAIPATTLTSAWYQQQNVTTETWNLNPAAGPTQVVDQTAHLYFNFPYPNESSAAPIFYDTRTEIWSGPNFATATSTAWFTTTHPYHTAIAPWTSPAGTTSISTSLHRSYRVYYTQGIWAGWINDFQSLKTDGRLRLRLTGFTPGASYKVTLKLLPIVDQITGTSMGPQLFRINTTTTPYVKGVTNQAFPANGIKQFSVVAPTNGCFDVTPHLISNPIYYDYYLTGKLSIVSITLDN